MMNMKSLGLRIVVLESPYDAWEDPRARELFSLMIRLKLVGFKPQYPYGVMPVDTTDFIGTHCMICRETAHDLLPLTAFKSLTVDKAKAHQLPFSALTLARNTQRPEHALALQAIMDRCHENGLTLAYDSSYTIEPLIRGDSEFMSLLRDAFVGMYVSFCRDYQIDERILLGVLRFKTDQLFLRWGATPLALNGVRCGPYQAPHLVGAEGELMHLVEFSASAKSAAERCQELWDRRITIATKADFISAKKAA